MSSSCAQCSQITLMRGRSHYSLFQCRILRNTQICSWSFRSALKMSGADQAPGRVWRDGWPTVPLTGFAIVSDGMRSDRSAALELSRSVPDEFRELAEKDL